jgi:hypothetical protein
MNPLDPRARFEALCRVLDLLGRRTPVVAPTIHLLADLDRIRYAGPPQIPEGGPLATWDDEENVYIEADLGELNGLPWDVDLCLRDGKLFIRMGRGR